MPRDWNEFSSDAETVAPDPSEVDEESGELEPDDETSESAEPDLYYSTLDEFVRGFLIHGYARHINGHTRVWAARYWEYPEAMSRLGAMWRAWEYLRKDSHTGLSVWYLNHADPHMRVLLDKDGPFAAADHDALENTNSPGEPLPYVAEEASRTA
ncbi:DUF4913 domain-containing protein [Pseudoclavibacter helvolus]|uniref:DUF4913 domain-containing protein n=1 Tax=Pseudoclavibacter helvolus TaxID=255205 RepID=UPI0035ECE18C